MKLTSEHEIQKAIQVALSRHKCTVFRANVGKVLTAEKRWFDTGLPKGHPDLYGFRWVDNQIFYIEVKNHVGKPSEDQIRFHEMLESHGIIHGVARSAKEALTIVYGGLIGYGFE